MGGIGQNSLIEIASRCTLLLCTADCMMHCHVHIVHIVHYKALLQCIAPGCILLLNIRLFVAAVHCLQVRGTLETEQKEGSLRAIVIV